MNIRLDQDRPSGRRIETLLKFLVSILILTILLTKVSIESIWDLPSQFSYLWAAVYIAFFFLVITSYSMRYFQLFKGEVQLTRLFLITSWQTVIGNLVATSVGAISYVGILKRQEQISIHSGISNLVFVKIFDVLLFLTIFCISGLFYWERAVELRPILVVGIVFLFVMTLTMVFAGKIISILRLAQVERARRWKRFLKSLDLMNQFVSNFSNLDIVSMSITAGFTIITMLFASIASYYLLSYRVHIGELITIVSLTQVLGIIPIQTMGGLGITDVSEYYLLGLFGYSGDQLAAVIVGKRLFFYFINFLLLLGLNFFRINPSREKHNQ